VKRIARLVEEIQSYDLLGQYLPLVIGRIGSKALVRGGRQLNLPAHCLA
jgi:hypothetical protein